MRKIICNSEEDTAVLAKEIASSLNPKDMIAFSGSMGMGKTTFTRYLIDALGGPDVVSSPTFAIMNEYDCPKFMIYHFDMYRITGIDDLYSTGFFDYLGTDSVMIIEWSENIIEALPESTIYIDIELGETETQRIFTIR